MPGTSLVELRLLDGPNLYFTRAATKLVLDIGALSDLSAADATALATAVGLSRVRPGDPDSAHRQRFAMRLVARLVRRVALDAGTARLGLRVRAGSGLREVVVAYPWRHHDRAVALGQAVAQCLDACLDGCLQDTEGVLRAAAVVDERLAAASTAVRGAPAGRRPSAVRARVPVASVTGTNGKTTTTRLLAHIAMTAGLRTGWSSTDGVVVQGEVVEPGDYSGPAGARAVLDAPGVQCAVLETARGGLLLRGMGVVANDVSVVTNVSADHLGMQGIDTVDQLAEVKAIITRVTSPSGWCVLNGDDPRVLAMLPGTPARPWVFSLHPDSPALRTALDAGGRGITVLDGEVVVLRPDGDPDRLVNVLDLPIALCGLSRHNLANALAAAAAALGLGLAREAVVEGLRTFSPDVRLNPGRLNVWSLPVPGGTVTVVIDLAHNEAGLEALMDVCEGLRAPGSLVRLGLGTAGDRSDDLLNALGEIAGRRSDQVVTVHKERYLRGRTLEDMQAQLATGLARVGVADVPAYADELSGLRALAAGAGAGDVVAMMCHADRELLDDWLQRHGATPDGPDQVRTKVVAARGQHPLEEQIAALHRAAPVDRQRLLLALLDADPDDPRLMHEWASALDDGGLPAQAVPAYRAALRDGLREPHRHQALIGLGSSLRVLGRPAEAVSVLTQVVAERPESVAAHAFLALALLESGHGDQAVRLLVESLVAHAGADDDRAYAPALLRIAGDLPAAPG